MQNDDHKTGNFHSWNIIDNQTAIKKTDKSVFKFRGSGIPKETRWFWDVQDFEKGKKERAEIKFHFRGNQYLSYIKLEARGRTRVFWYTDFASKLKNSCSYSLDRNEFPSLVFKKKEANNFII